MTGNYYTDNIQKHDGHTALRREAGGTSQQGRDEK